MFAVYVPFILDQESTALLSEANSIRFPKSILWDPLNASYNNLVPAASSMMIASRGPKNPPSSCTLNEPVNWDGPIVVKLPDIIALPVYGNAFPPTFGAYDADNAWVAYEAVPNNEPVKSAFTVYAVIVPVGPSICTARPPALKLVAEILAVVLSSWIVPILTIWLRVLTDEAVEAKLELTAFKTYEAVWAVWIYEAVFAVWAKVANEALTACKT